MIAAFALVAQFGFHGFASVINCVLARSHARILVVHENLNANVDPVIVLFLTCY